MHSSKGDYSAEVKASATCGVTLLDLVPLSLHLTSIRMEGIAVHQMVILSNFLVLEELFVTIQPLASIFLDDGGIANDDQAFMEARQRDYDDLIVSLRGLPITLRRLTVMASCKTPPRLLSLDDALLRALSNLTNLESFRFDGFDLKMDSDGLLPAVRQWKENGLSFKYSTPALPQLLELIDFKGSFWSRRGGPFSLHPPPPVTQVMLLMARAPSARMLTHLIASYTFNVTRCNKEGGLPAVLMALTHMSHRLSGSTVFELTFLNIGNRGPARPLLEALFSSGPATFVCGGKLILQGLYVDA